VSGPVAIERAELFIVPLALREPFRSSASVVRARRVLLVALHAGDVTGWGECVAQETTSYAPETTETAWSILCRLVPAALPGSGGRRDGLDASPNPSEEARHQPMARAALEMAGWDLRAKLEGLPLCRALGGELRPVAAGVSLGLEDDVDRLLRRVEGFLAEGYRRVKLKIEPGRDVAWLERVRARFPDAALSVDANGAYGPSDVERLRDLDDFGLTMIEQPFPADALREHAALQASLRTPICLDESIRSRADARRALDLGSCRVVNVKPGRVGGLGEAREIHDLCREAGVPVWCGGMLESGVGRAHNVALATLPGFTLPGDLSASRRYWARDLVSPEWELSSGALVPLDAPGIGVEPDVATIEKLAERRKTFQ
jgi:O-succinylbenzoate synthase